MKKIIGINGSARKNWNTHILLNKALEGARQTGAETELYNLYDLNYKGCIGCLACKLKGSKDLGRCVINDDLKTVLNKIDNCDGFILGSPVYLGEITAMMRAFFERLIFQYLSYDDYSKPYFKRNIKTAFIYTMNAPVEAVSQFGLDKTFEKYEEMLKMYFGHSEIILCGETLQVNDYDKYHMSSWNGDDRHKRRKEVFPDECKLVYEFGGSFVKSE